MPGGAKDVAAPAARLGRKWTVPVLHGYRRDRPAGRCLRIPWSAPRLTIEPWFGMPPGACGAVPIASLQRRAWSSPRIRARTGAGQARLARIPGDLQRFPSEIDAWGTVLPVVYFQAPCPVCVQDCPCWCPCLFYQPCAPCRRQWLDSRCIGRTVERLSKNPRADGCSAPRPCASRGQPRLSGGVTLRMAGKSVAGAAFAGGLLGIGGATAA